jgi:hypothetical protein
MNNVPIPMPRTKLVTTSCAALSASGESVAAMSGMAGSIASMEIAMVANSMATRAMNSVCDTRASITLPSLPVLRSRR